MSIKSSEPARVLLIDDDEDDYVLTRDLLANVTRTHYVLEWAARGDDALRKMDAEPFDVLLVDYQLGAHSGLDFIRALHGRPNEVPAILLTGQDERDLDYAAASAGAVDFLDKAELDERKLDRSLWYAISNQKRVLAERMLAKELKQKARLHQRLEEMNTQLIQSEKMAGIGQLAAGIAHEINNPAGYVSSNLNSLEGYILDLKALMDSYSRELESCTCRPPEPVAESWIWEDLGDIVEESRQGMQRIRKIVADLKDFCHRGGEQMEVRSLTEGLESTLNVVWNEIKYKAEIIKEFHDIPDVECDLAQLNQVFLNLLVNAAQAIEDRGVITLRTQFNDDSVTVEFEDNGKGIPEENLPRLFEPFYTTKPVGIGTGLGLSISYGIIERHHGTIDVESQIGKGTLFRIQLPVRQPG